MMQVRSLPGGITEINCKIAGQSGIWVWCANPNNGSVEYREQVWYDMTRVAMVKEAAR